MGGIVPPKPNIYGTVDVPGIHLAANPETGLYRRNSGIGVSIQTAAYLAMFNSFMSIGPVQAQAIGPTQIAGSPYATGNVPQDCVVSPDNQHVYITNFTANSITAYSRDVSTGALTAVAGSPFAATASPYEVAITPDGSFLYVSNFIAGTIDGFSRNSATGALTPLAGSPFASGLLITSGIVVSQDGRHLIVAGRVAAGTGGTAVFDINAATGAIAAVAGSPFAFTPGNADYWTAITPDGNFVYTSMSNTVIVYSRDAATGILTQAFTYTVGVGLSKNHLIVSPDGQYVILVGASAGSDALYVYQIQSTGALAEVAGSPFDISSAGTPYQLAMPPASDYLYMSTLGGVAGLRIYSFDGTTGAPTEIAGSPFAAGILPSGVCVTPDGQNIFTVDGTGNQVFVYQPSAAMAASLFSLTFDQSGRAGGSVNINGQLNIVGPLKLSGSALSSLACLETPVAMVANAGTLALVDNADNIVTVTGVLTATGDITTTFPANPCKVVFDNQTTGLFALTLNTGAYTVPPGTSSWYWDGATLEIVSSDGYRTANVTPLPVGLTTQAVGHLMAGPLSEVCLELVCLVAEHSYPVGAIIRNPFIIGATNEQITTYEGAAGLVFIIPAAYTFGIQSLTTGLPVVPTPANWAWRFFARQ